MNCLLDVLQGKVGAQSLSDVEWEQAFELAEAEQVLPSFVSTLRRSGLPLSPSIEKRLCGAERQCAIAGFFWSAELRGLLKSFAEAAVPVLPLKGPSLALRAYGEAAFRSAKDLDLLVQRSDHAAAESILLKIGFAPNRHADDYHRQWSRGTTLVELHFDLENPLAFDFKVETAWQRASPGEFQGQPAWHFAAEDELLFLALHGVRHRFERLSHVLDLALAFRAFAPNGSLAVPRADVAPISRLLVLGAELANLLFPEEPMPIVPADNRTKRKMDTLAKSLWQDLLCEPAGQLDWQTQHRFFVETEVCIGGRYWCRIKHMRILLTRTIEADHAFANRLGLMRHWQVALLRPIRLLLRDLKQRRSKPRIRQAL
ncbi:nucleotidyltransferase domain-containing protein [Granulicella tundricola]|nr:nucleotidyltransferase family protein [Granulicella tundricola]